MHGPTELLTIGYAIVDRVAIPRAEQLYEVYLKERGEEEASL
jgi:hypothetical protein